jgi:ribosomal protein S18 acetylase RimI-like enzyme
MEYRSFKNTDPPGLAEVWNESFTGRGAFPLRSNMSWEHSVFSKPYFDRDGLIVAEEDGRIVGFAHAGFGPNAAETDISTEIGLICAVAVRPSHRRRKIGTELLRRCERYLQELRVHEFVAGGLKPFNPFYFGMYGGSDSPGFLVSDAGAAPFFEHNGYLEANTTLVFELQLESFQPPVDNRFLNLRRAYDVQLLPQPELNSWWQDCVFGPFEPVEFRLMDKLSGIPAARTLIWEMSSARPPGFPMAGILDLQVRPEVRRRGLARFLLTQMLRYLQEQFFRIIEVHVPEMNTTAAELIHSLGFAQVDVGHTYRRPASPVVVTEPSSPAP